MRRFHQKVYIRKVEQKDVRIPQDTQLRRQNRKMSVCSLSTLSLGKKSQEFYDQFPFPLRGSDLWNQGTRDIMVACLCLCTHNLLSDTVYEKLKNCNKFCLLLISTEASIFPNLFHWFYCYFIKIVIRFSNKSSTQILHMSCSIHITYTSGFLQHTGWFMHGHRIEVCWICQQ